MKGISDYAVVYDISSNAERRKVDKIVKGFGFRIQKSVFECRLKKYDLKQLKRNLTELKIETRFVKIYRLEYSWKGCEIGKMSPNNIDDDNIYIV